MITSATTDAEDAASVLAGQQEAARRSLLAFTRFMFRSRKGYDFVVNWHHIEICRALMRVFRGECTRLIINIPPRYSKTEIAVVNFIAWALGHVPDAEFIHTSYSGGLAANNAFMARNLVETDAYAGIFPGVRLRTDSKARNDWRTVDGGVVYAQGSGGTITGYGAGKLRQGFGGAIIIDDPHKADEARSDTMRKNVIDWFGNTLESRGNGENRSTPIIVIMQRLHESDLSGFLLAGGNGEKWDHVAFPALSDDGATALWPAKHTVQALQAMQRANPYVFAGQYQQRPAPLAGGEFKPDAIGYVDAIPVGTRMVRAWDFAGTEADGDFTAGAALGQIPDGRYIIADMVHMQEASEKVDEALVNTAGRDGVGVSIAIPQDPGSAGKGVARAMTKLLAGYSVSSKPVSGDKVLRARPLASQVNVGNVVMLRAPWNLALVNEMRNFPNGKNDDQIDALSLGFDSLTDNTLGLLEYYKQEAAEAAQLRTAAKAQPGPPAAFDGFKGFIGR
jgi:predicted phage terminase large subunit-like protein